MKNSNESIGNLTRDLPICSAVPQPSASPRAPWKQVLGWNDKRRTEIIILEGSRKFYFSSSTIEMTKQMRWDEMSVTLRLMALWGSEKCVRISSLNSEVEGLLRSLDRGWEFVVLFQGLYDGAVSTSDDTAPSNVIVHLWFWHTANWDGSTHSLPEVRSWKLPRGTEDYQEKYHRE